MASNMEPPTGKLADGDFAFSGYYSVPTALLRHPASPLGQRPLGAEGAKVSRAAAAGRRALIQKVLIPQLSDLIKVLHTANLDGQIGTGEIALLGELQHWLHQLQVERDDLGQAPKKPVRGKKKR